MYKFIEQKQSWFKRRVPTEEQKILEEFEVIGFEKKNNHRCTMNVVINGEVIELIARVTQHETYEIMEDGSTKIHYGDWSVQGTNPYGISVILKLIE